MSRIRALGLDISNYQTPVDFDKMRKEGVSFVFIKASQNEWTDKSFQTNWEGARERGLLRGAYHFYDMRENMGSAKQQADYFSNLLASEPGELLPVLDFESPGVAGYPNYPSHEISCKIVTDFCNRVKKNIGIFPMIYTNNAGINSLAPLSSMIRSLDLWISWLGSESPQNPYFSGWSDWRFWQYSFHGDGKKFGVGSGDVDKDAFNGTIDDLYDYANRLRVSKRILYK